MLEIEFDFRDFDRWIKQAKKDLEEVTSGIIEMFANEALARIMNKTPVDTGRARAGWRVAKTGKLKFTVFNTVHYIIYLEFGHSKQAPRGMVAITIQELKRLYESGWFMQF